MNNFTHYCPTKYLFGKDQEKNTGVLCKEFGATKVMIVYGGGSVVKTGLLDRIKAILAEQGLAFLEFSGVKPNPRVEHVREGVDLARREGVDFLLAVGGGSVIDAAKGIGIGMMYDSDLWDFFTRTKNPTAMMPVGCVLTIAAAGSEGSPNCVLNSEERGEKVGTVGDVLRPKFAVLNPELTYTLPPYQTACGVTDIMMHTMERYFTPVLDNQLTDELCEGLLRTMIHYGPKALKDPADYNTRAQIMWAGTIAHNNTVGVGRIQDSSSHRIQVLIGAKYDSAHGAGLATVCPAWMQYVYKCPEVLPRFVRYAVQVWGVQNDPWNPEEVAMEGIMRLKEFFRSLGMPVTLEELGVRDEDIDSLCEGLNVGNLVKLTPEDVRNIYELMR